MALKKVYVNILSQANVSAARYEKRNGRDVVIVPSATLPDDIVMNDIKYSAAEIEKSFMTLNRTPAPFGHPTINGAFVSASDPEGINLGYIGAWNENVRREGGRVLLDKVIDVDFANQSQNGKDVLDAVKNGAPVHTSTALYCMLDSENDVSADDAWKYCAIDMHFDHDAILLNEDGAGTPEQGVGMMVNGKAVDPETGEEIQIINSALERADNHLDWALSDVADALVKREKAGMMDRIKAVLVEAFSSTNTITEPQKNESEEEMADEKKLDDLTTQVNDLIKKMPEMIVSAVTPLVAPLIETQKSMQANMDAANTAELSGYVAAIVKANILTEAETAELTLNSAKALAAKIPPVGTAMNAFGGPPDGAGADPWGAIDLNADMVANLKIVEGA